MLLGIHALLDLNQADLEVLNLPRSVGSRSNVNVHVIHEPQQQATLAVGKFFFPELFCFNMYNHVLHTL